MASAKAKKVCLSIKNSHTRKSVNSFPLSKKFIKKIAKISMLNILHSRIAIPEGEFITRTYCETPYVIFRSKSKNYFINLYHATVHGVIEAIDKNNVNEIIMTISDQNTNDILEKYIIKIKYNKHPDGHNKPDHHDVKAATAEFIGNLQQLPGNKWAEEDVDFCAYLSYVQGVPQDSEPSYFTAADNELDDASLGELDDASLGRFVNIGSINTGYHYVSTIAKGRNFGEARPTTPPLCRVLAHEAKNNSSEIIILDDSSSSTSAEEQEEYQEPDDYSPLTSEGEQEEYQKPSGPAFKKHKKTHNSGNELVATSSYGPTTPPLCRVLDHEAKNNSSEIIFLDDSSSSTSAEEQEEYQKPDDFSPLTSEGEQEEYQKPGPAFKKHKKNHNSGNESVASSSSYGPTTPPLCRVLDHEAKNNSSEIIILDDSSSSTSAEEQEEYQKPDDFSPLTSEGEQEEYQKPGPAFKKHKKTHNSGNESVATSSSSYGPTTPPLCRVLDHEAKNNSSQIIILDDSSPLTSEEEQDEYQKPSGPAFKKHKKTHNSGNKLVATSSYGMGYKESDDQWTKHDTKFTAGANRKESENKLKSLKVKSNNSNTNDLRKESEGKLIMNFGFDQGPSNRNETLIERKSTIFIEEMETSVDDSTSSESTESKKKKNKLEEAESTKSINESSEDDLTYSAAILKSTEFLEKWRARMKNLEKNIGGMGYKKSDDEGTEHNTKFPALLGTLGANPKESKNKMKSLEVESKDSNINDLRKESEGKLIMNFGFDQGPSNRNETLFERESTIFIEEMETSVDYSTSSESTESKKRINKLEEAGSTKSINESSEDDSTYSAAIIKSIEFLEKWRAKMKNPNETIGMGHKKSDDQGTLGANPKESENKMKSLEVESKDSNINDLRKESEGELIMNYGFDQGLSFQGSMEKTETVTKQKTARVFDNTREIFELKSLNKRRNVDFEDVLSDSSEVLGFCEYLEKNKAKMTNKDKGVKVHDNPIFHEPLVGNPRPLLERNIVENPIFPQGIMKKVKTVEKKRKTVRFSV